MKVEQFEKLVDLAVASVRKNKPKPADPRAAPIAECISGTLRFAGCGEDLTLDLMLDVGRFTLTELAAWPSNEKARYVSGLTAGCKILIDELSVRSVVPTDEIRQGELGAWRRAFELHSIRMRDGG